MPEIPVRMPPPLSEHGYKLIDGTLVKVPKMSRRVVFECGEEARLRGTLVICTRRKGHPVRINYGHSNGYDEWCF